MAAELIDGAKVAARVRDEVKRAIEKMPVKPGLATILVGDDPASARSMSARSGAPVSSSGSVTCTTTFRRTSRRRPSPS